MGKNFLDQYTFLHFATGVVSYYWGLTLCQWMILHFIFENLENTQIGMKIINTYFPFWPGGKPYADTFINILGDNIGALCGWTTAYYLDQLGSQYGWYSPHIKNAK